MKEKYRSTVLWIRIGFMRIRIQQFRSMRTLVPIQGVGDQNCNILQLKKYPIFSIKNRKTLSLGLHEVRPSYRRSLQPSTENICHLTTIHFFTFFFSRKFCTPRCIWNIFLPNMDPDPADQNQCGSFRIWILNIVQEKVYKGLKVWEKERGRLWRDVLSSN